MKLKKETLIVWTLFITIALFTSFVSYTYAGQGCCSHHGGQNYCDTNTGRWVCNDGTYSPTCTCSGGEVLTDSSSSSSSNSSNSNKSNSSTNDSGKNSNVEDDNQNTFTRIVIICFVIIYIGHIVCAILGEIIKKGKIIFKEKYEQILLKAQSKKGKVYQVVEEDEEFDLKEPTMHEESIYTPHVDYHIILSTLIFTVVLVFTLLMIYIYFIKNYCDINDSVIVFLCNTDFKYIFIIFLTAVIVIVAIYTILKDINK